MKLVKNNKMLLENQKMASNIHFEKWTADQVAEWLRGVDMDDAMIPYMHFFLNNKVDGKKLMLMTHSDLEKLNVTKFGHQELILEAIDLLRNLRYGYETENLQSLALQLGCKARSLNGEIRARTGENDRNRANTLHAGDGHRRLSVGILSSVADLISTLKSLVAWMDKAPFSGFHDLCLVRNTIVKQGLDMINMCQKEANYPDVELNLSNTTKTLSEICEKLVIGSADTPLDPLYLQPASLEQATIRKKPGEELGMHIQSLYYGVHVISQVKDMSPADLCGKIEKGDEVIQVNNQVIAGWSLQKLVSLLKENPKEVVLLLKKRPRHISPYGQMKRQNMMNKHAGDFSTLPKSIKKLRSRDGEPKQLRPSLQEFGNIVPSAEETEDIDSPKETNDGNDTDNDVFRSGSESPQFQQFSLPVQPDPKQRRATVSGGSPTLSRPLLVIEDIDTPSRPKSFTIASASSDMPHEIIINSPSGDNLAELHKFASAVEKRQEFKTKSTPPSLEFSVLKPTPKLGDTTPISVETKFTVDHAKQTIPEIVYNSKDNITEANLGVVTEEKLQAEPEGVSESSVETTSAEGASFHERVNQSPERLLDSSTDSVPPSESSMESSQTCTSSLESSSHSPPLEETSVSSEKENSDIAYSESFGSPTISSYVLEAPKRRREPCHFEVASDFNRQGPQLMRIRRIPSVHGNPSPNQSPGGEVDHAKKDRHVGFKDLDSDKEADGNQGYVVKIVAGVPQRFPVNTSPEVKRRPKTGKKKVDRRVSCKDLGQGDCQGWLLKRKAKGKSGLFSHWDKRWCVIKDYNMFCYPNKEALRAEVVIHLPAFKVSPVTSSDFKTNKFAFKIHNAGTSFNFASETQTDMSKWMNKMGLAAITFEKNSGFKKPDPEKFTKEPDPDFSESDTEDEPHHGALTPELRASLASSTSSLSSVGRNSGSLASMDKVKCGSTPSLTTVGKEQGATGGLRAGSPHLRAPSPDKRASQEDLAVLFRRQSQRGQDIFGKDLHKKRRSALSKELEEEVSPELIKYKKVKSLERTLQAKEKELQEIEEVLRNLSHAKLQEYQEHHQSDLDVSSSEQPET